MLHNFAPPAGGFPTCGASRLAYVHIYMLFYFYMFYWQLQIYGHFCIKLSVLCLSPSVCSSIGISLQLLFSFVYVFYCRVLIFGVALQPMPADSLLSGYLLCRMALVLQYAAQPLQVEYYSIKLASS